MRCESYCKYFKEKSVGASVLFSEKTKVVWYGYCNKYYINTSTNNDCLDSLPYHEK